MMYFLRFLTVLSFCLLSFNAVAAPQGWAPLLKPAQLASILQQAPEVRVIHVTGDFSKGHIPSAVSAPYAQFRGPQDNPGAVPDLASLTRTVQQLGITADTPVAVIHQGSSASDMGAATRVYWTLKSLGVKNLAVLNGGFNAWVAQGLPIDTAATTVAQSNFSPRWHDDWQATTQQVESLVGDGNAQLVDARQTEFFEGLQASSGRPGTIQGAGNLSFESWFEGSRVKAPAQVSSILTSYSDTVASVTVSFCNTGHFASINWFMMSEVAGKSNTRLYAESMTEWSMADRPMDNEPSRIRHYWQMTTDWVSGLVGS